MHRKLIMSRIFLAIAVLIGAALQAHQYLSHQSYWQDEASLLLNAAKFSAASLPFTQLNATLNTQAGPPAFLWWITGMMHLTGGGEYAMRLIPLLAGMGSLIVLAIIAGRILGTGPAFFAVAIVALSDHVIFESATLKPYSGDFLAALVLLWIARPWNEAAPRHRFMTVAATAALGVWGSYPLVFSFAAISLAAMIPMLRSRQRAEWVFGNVIVMVSFAVVYWFCIRAQRNAYLDRYWEDRFFDFRHAGNAAVHLAWMTAEIFRFLLPPWGIVLLAPAIIGAVGWWRQGRKSLVISLAGVIVLVGAASVAHAYPYGGTRVTLFWLGHLAILSAGGVQMIVAQIRRRAIGCALWTIAAAPIVAAAWMATTCLIHPRSYGEMRAVTAYVRASAEPGELICVVGNGMPTLDWYWRGHGRNVVRGVDPNRTATLQRFWVVDSYDPRQGRRALSDHDRQEGFEIDEAHSLRIRGGDALLFVKQINR